MARIIPSDISPLALTGAHSVKKSSPVFESEGHRYEFHWHEHYGIGRFETKLKPVPQK